MNKKTYIEAEVDKIEEKFYDANLRLTSDQRNNLWTHFGHIYDEAIDKLENKQEAAAKLEEKVKEAYDAIKEAKRMADEHGLCFYFAAEHGMGGTYYGTNYCDWNSSTAVCMGQEYWSSSTMKCEEGIYPGNWKFSSEDC